MGVAPAPPAPPKRVAIRQKGVSRELTAYQSLKSELLSSVSGRQYRADPGDWVILQAGAVLDVYSDHDFRIIYEIVEEGGLSLTAKDQATLEKVLGFGSTRSSDMLTNQVARLARCRLGEIALDFTVPQWEELQNRANKQGQTLDVFMQRLVDRFMQDVWTRI